MHHDLSLVLDADGCVVPRHVYEREQAKRQEKAKMRRKQPTTDQYVTVAIFLALCAFFGYLYFG